MNISEHSLMGNVKHNTATMFSKVKRWAVAQQFTEILYVDILMMDNGRQAKKKLIALAEKYQIPHSRQTSKRQLAERIKLHFRRQEFITP